MTSTRHFNVEICFLRRFHWILMPRFGRGEEEKGPVTLYNPVHEKNLIHHWCSALDVKGVGNIDDFNE